MLVLYITAGAFIIGCSLVFVNNNMVSQRSRKMYW